MFDLSGLYDIVKGLLVLYVLGVLAAIIWAPWWASTVLALPLVYILVILSYEECKFRILNAQFKKPASEGSRSEAPRT